MNKNILQQKADKITFTIIQDYIVKIECEPGSIMNLEEGLLSTKIIAEMINNNPLPMLCDLTNVVKMSKECRDHFAGPNHAKVFTKCALIINSPISKIIGNFFLGANKPLRPTRLFTSKEDGLEWLKI